MKPYISYDKAKAMLEIPMPPEKKNLYRIRGHDASGAEWESTYSAYSISIAQELFMYEYGAIEITRAERIN